MAHAKLWLFEFVIQFMVPFSNIPFTLAFWQTAFVVSVGHRGKIISACDGMIRRSETLFRYFLCLFLHMHKNVLPTLDVELKSAVFFSFFPPF